MPFIQQNTSSNPNCFSHILFALNLQQVIFESVRPNQLNKFESIEHTSQSSITCSKLTMQTLEQGVKYVQS